MRFWTKIRNPDPLLLIVVRASTYPRPDAAYKIQTGKTTEAKYTAGALPSQFVDL